MSNDEYERELMKTFDIINFKGYNVVINSDPNKKEEN